MEQSSKMIFVRKSFSINLVRRVKIVIPVLKNCFVIIHQVKTKKITTMKKVWKIYHSRQCFIGYPDTSNLVKKKILRCASYFQLSFRCMDIAMKHCLSCLVYDMKDLNGIFAFRVENRREIRCLREGFSKGLETKATFTP